MTGEMEEHQNLTRTQKMKKVLPKVLPLLLLSVILPTADVGTDLAILTKLYTGLTACVDRDQEEYRKCQDEVGPDQHCTPEKVSNNTVCGVSQYNCEGGEGSFECQYEVGPDRYCTSEEVSKNNNTVCGLKKSSDSRYFCRYYKIWSSDWKDYEQCQWHQGGDKYCSDPASNQNVCAQGNHPEVTKLAHFLLFFFVLNYLMGLVTCVRLEGTKWIPLMTALLNFYPQYCKQLKQKITLFSMLTF